MQNGPHTHTQKAAKYYPSRCALQQESTRSSLGQGGASGVRTHAQDRRAHEARLLAPYPVIVGGVRVLVTGDDLGGHPVGGAYERVPPPHGPVQLGAHPEVHCGQKKEGQWTAVSKPVENRTHREEQGLRSKPHTSTAWTCDPPATRVSSTPSRAKSPQRQDAQPAWGLPQRPVPTASLSFPQGREALLGESGARTKRAWSRAKR